VAEYLSCSGLDFNDVAVQSEKDAPEKCVISLEKSSEFSLLSRSFLAHIPPSNATYPACAKSLFVPREVQRLQIKNAKLEIPQHLNLLGIIISASISNMICLLAGQVCLAGKGLHPGVRLPTQRELDWLARLLQNCLVNHIPV